MRKIGIVVIATNAYFVFGIKFIKRFQHFYEGQDDVKFYFFSDTDPAPYLHDSSNVKHILEYHKLWVDATNSKFNNILRLQGEDLDYLYYFDADTSVSRAFTTDWMIGDLVGGEHFGNRSWMQDKKAFDRNPASKAYVPEDTPLPQMYYYGAFFGGRKDKLMEFCSTLVPWQQEDKRIPYEPAVNDESYINAYFHNNPPTVVTLENFPFQVSDKSGVQGTRDTSIDVTSIKKDLLKYKGYLVDIVNGKVIAQNKIQDVESKVFEAHGEYWCNSFDCPTLMESREKVFEMYCTGKKVLHVGCVDYPFSRLDGLHSHLVKYADVDGVDINKEGIDKFKENFDGEFYYDVAEVTGKYDVVLVPEVLEHVHNAGEFLAAVDKVQANQLVLTVPDVLSCHTYKHFELLHDVYTEACHPDHVAWYSPHTVRNIIERNTSYKCDAFYMVNGRSIMVVAKRS